MVNFCYISKTIYYNFTAELFFWTLFWSFEHFKIRLWVYDNNYELFNLLNCLTVSKKINIANISSHNYLLILRFIFEIKFKKKKVLILYCSYIIVTH